MTEPTFPRPYFSDAEPHFRRPFAANAVKWKVQSTLRGNRGLLVGYVDARLVTERLSVVVGENWSSHLREFGTSGDVLCTLRVFDVEREDVGKGSFLKASASDALKRAAVLFGIGASLYATPTRILASTESGEIDSNGKPTLKRVKNRKGDDVLYITPASEKWLAEQYSIWLLGEGEKRFGESFDHGEASSSIGDAAVEGLPVEDESPDTDARRQEIQTAYAALDGAARKKLPKGRFTAHLKAADTPERLDELAEKIAGLGA